MRVNGRWHRFRDGVERPVVDAAVRSPTGTWERALMVLDSGADRTIFSADYLPVLAPPAAPGAATPAAPPALAGVGGQAGCVFVQTTIAFTRDDGVRVVVRGMYGLFTDLASSDVPLLGRDVTNNFEVVYSYPARRVALLAPPHRVSY